MQFKSIWPKPSLLYTTTSLVIATQRCSTFLKGTLADLVQQRQRYVIRNVLMETIQHWNHSSLFITTFLTPTWAKCAGIKAVKHPPPKDAHDGDYSQVTSCSMVPISVGIHTRTLGKQSCSSSATACGWLPSHPLVVGDSVVLSPGTWVALSAPSLCKKLRSLSHALRCCLSTQQIIIES